MAGVEGIEEVHDLHVWEITSGFPALAAHVLVGQGEDRHERSVYTTARSYGRVHYGSAKTRPAYLCQIVNCGEPR